jgi:mxaA protein
MQVKCNPSPKSIGYWAYDLFCDACACVSKWIVLLFVPWACHAAPVDISIDRAYGYVIGDVIEQVAVVDVPRGSVIDVGTLPKLGRQGGWVELVFPVAVKRLDEEHLRLTLRYQLMNAPREVTVVFLPGIKFKLLGENGQFFERSLPAQAISASPITRDEAFTRAGMEAMRPEREVLPMPVETFSTSMWRWLGAAAIAFLGAGAVLWWRRSRQAEGPFARAARSLRMMRESGDAEESIRRMHAAFNETAGRSVFAESLETFFADKPEYQSMRVEITQFYARSRRVFFDPVGKGELQAFSLKDFVRALVRIERRRQA